MVDVIGERGYRALVVASLSGSAEFSEGGSYRYRLERNLTGRLGAKPQTCAFIMLNPSTADAAEDDPTIRRCRQFAEGADCSRLLIGNLYALRSTDPSQLLSSDDPVGPANDSALRRIVHDADLIVLAWGTSEGRPPDFYARQNAVRRAPQDEQHGRVFCLGVCKDRNPRHPLYLPSRGRWLVWDVETWTVHR